MGNMNLLWLLACAAPALADPIQFSDNGLASSLALVQNGSSTDIQMQLSGPSSAGWAGVGVGAEMAGSLFFVIYPSASGQSVTVSVRGASGHVMPTVIPNMQYSVTNSSMDSSTGTMTAQFTCYGCTTWPSGTLDTTSTQQSFIYALGPGDTIQSDDPNAQIEQHSQKGAFSGNAAMALTQSSGTNAPSPPPLAPQGTNNSGSSSDDDYPKRSLVLAHAVILCLVFFFFMPSAVFVLRLPFTRSIAFQGHWIIQMLAWLLAVVGLIIALVFSKQSEELKSIPLYHQIIGIVVLCLTIVQPLGGVFHHWQYKKVLRRSIVSYGHIVLGWIIIFLGMLNATFGFRLVEDNASAEGIGAAGIVILLAMLAVSAWAGFTRSSSQRPTEQIKREAQDSPST